MSHLNIESEMKIFGNWSVYLVPWIRHSKQGYDMITYSSCIKGIMNAAVYEHYRKTEEKIESIFHDMKKLKIITAEVTGDQTMLK